MKMEGEGQLLRVFIGESDRWHGKPLYEAIVLKAREMGIAGATVLRGVMGFGADSRLHTAKVLRLSEDLPVVVEIVDKPDRIAALLPHLDEMVSEGVVTLEDVHIVAYRHSAGPIPGTGGHRGWKTDEREAAVADGGESPSCGFHDAGAAG